MRYPLDKRVKGIRDLINSPRKQNALRQDEAFWLMLCSCMDTIQDTEAALEGFLTGDADSYDRGRRYLHIYGALQALFVQQDAVENLQTSLEIQDSREACIQKIRDIRNYATGHPTNKTEKGVEGAFNFIHFGEDNPHQFHLMTVYPGKSNDGGLNSKHKEVNVEDLIATQKGILMKVLDNVIETLKEEEVEHRKKFSDKKLADVFSEWTFLFGNIFDKIYSPHSGHAQYVVGCIDSIMESISVFKEGLMERGEPDDNWSEVYENLDYALQQLKAHFDLTSQAHINGKDVYIFACFAQQQVEDLSEFAEEIDEKYSQ